MRFRNCLLVNSILLLCCSPVEAQVSTALIQDAFMQVDDLSRDGRYLVLIGHHNQIRGSSLWRMRSDGTGLERLDIGNRRVRATSTSADGSKITFLQFEKRYGSGRWWFAYLGVWVYDFTKSKPLIQVDQGPAGRPLISDDGRKVVYTSSYKGFGTYIVNSNGTGKSRFSLFMQPTAIDRTGSRVVGSTPNGDDIWIMNTNGTGLRNLTNTPKVYESNATISADGKKVAFVRQSGTWPNITSEVMLINADGSGLQSRGKVFGWPSALPALSMSDDYSIIALTASRQTGPAWTSLFKTGSSTPVASLTDAVSFLNASGTRLPGITNNGPELWDLALPDLKAIGPEQIGKAEVFQVAANPGESFLLMFAAKKASIPLPPFGTLGLDPNSILPIAGGVMGKDSTTFRLSITIPSNAALIGRALFSQAFAIDPRTNKGSLTNTVELKFRK